MTNNNLHINDLKDHLVQLLNTYRWKNWTPERQGLTQKYSAKTNMYYPIVSVGQQYDHNLSGNLWIKVSLQFSQTTSQHHNFIWRLNWTRGCWSGGEKSDLLPNPLMCLLAVLNSLSHKLLSQNGRWLSPKWSKTEQREYPIWKPQFFHNLRLEVIFLHFCYILFIRSKLVCSAHIQGKELHKGMNMEKQR